jgi:hypothetical protein
MTPFRALIFGFVILAVLVPLPKPDIVATVEDPDGRVMVVIPPEIMVRFPFVRSEENILP